MKEKKKGKRLPAKEYVIPTGFTEIDEAIGGIKKKELTLICGRPYMGKTAFASNLALHAALKEHKKVLYFTISPTSVYEAELKMISILTKIPLGRVTHFSLSEEEWDLFAQSVKTIETSSIYLSMRYSLEHVKWFLKETVNFDVDLLIIDNLQDLKRKYADEKAPSPDELLTELKRLAVRKNIAIVVLSNLPRTLERRKDKHPKKSDLEKGGITINSWNRAFLLYRKDYYFHPLDHSQKMEVSVVTSDSKELQTVLLHFNIETLTLEDVFPFPNGEDETKEIDWGDENWYEEEKREIKERNLRILSCMKAYLEAKDYASARRCADIIRTDSFYEFKEELNNCYFVCAEHGDLEALLYCQSMQKRTGHPTVSESRYLKVLAKSGYILAFDRLGDCYLKGIDNPDVKIPVSGQEGYYMVPMCPGEEYRRHPGYGADLKNALTCYLKGVIFTDDNYCYRQVLSLSGGFEKMKKTFPEDIWKLFDEKEEFGIARVRLANKIYNGEVKEFPPAASYLIYKDLYLSNCIPTYEKTALTGMTAIYNLFTCLKEGIGTKRNPYAALYVLSDAIHTCELEMDLKKPEWVAIYKDLLDALIRMDSVYEIIDDSANTNRLIRKWIEEREGFVTTKYDDAKPVLHKKTDYWFIYDKKWDERITERLYNLKLMKVSDFIAQSLNIKSEE